MRGAAFVVVVGVLGCATGGRPTALAAPAAPVKKEVVVMGHGPPGPPPGEISIAPKDQGTDLMVAGRHLFRCTKMNPPPRDPENSRYCRDVTNGDSRNPDPGRLE